MPRYTFTPKEPLAKLPLATRREIRDKYESKKEDIESRIATALKLDKFSLNLNPNEIWAYHQNDNQNAGYVLAGYAEGFASAIESYAQGFGNDGINDFNSAVTKAELTVKVNELGKDAPTINTRIRDGVFEILFHHEKLGYNMSWLSKEDILSAVDAVPREGLSLEAKQSIDKNWEPNYEDVTDALREILNIPDLKLEPNFAENYNKLLPKKKDETSFKRHFGAATLAYFKDLKSKLENEKVKGDEMIQEGIQENLSEKIVKLRVVDKIKNGYYNGTAFEDGILYLETTPANWYVNTCDVANKLIESL